MLQCRDSQSFSQTLAAGLVCVRALLGHQHQLSGCSVPMSGEIFPAHSAPMSSNNLLLLKAAAEDAFHGELSLMFWFSTGRCRKPRSEVLMDACGP